MSRAVNQTRIKMKQINGSARNSKIDRNLKSLTIVLVIHQLNIPFRIRRTPTNNIAEIVYWLLFETQF